ISNLSFKAGQEVKVIAQVGTTCPTVNPPIFTVEMPQTAVPVINSPIYSGTNVVSGTSVEADGTAITITYVSGGTTTTYTDTVTNGTWSFTLPSGTFATGNELTATATATGKSTSVKSSIVTVINALTS